ncbi:hypothetical protein UPYG_G00321750 [Umbra pygmaea]|uniref:Kinase non-catalytic C-lobe domain-containing protein 1 n=1 Tax=Umbra pygmaea TaxID=75934 RepID=A0ABD0W4X4_UMBPY
MGTSVTDAAAFSGEDEGEEEEYYELEHLPPLLEDEENVSLADILSLRDTCLTEPEVCAVCVECVMALQSITPSALFHTLCITPDTLAFNAHGNVCFMEQLSDDPEGSFIPPEFDKTGSTIEGHIYSLGSTLSAALDFVIEPELEAELGEEIQRLLEQMQEEDPEERPLPQDILSLAEEQLVNTSSTALCRKLSSIGRRILSVESIATFQDGWTGSWEARWQSPKPNWQLHKSISTEDRSSRDQGIVLDAVAGVPEPNGTSRPLQHHVCGAWDSARWAEGMEDVEDEGCIRDRDLFVSQSDSRSQNSSPVCRRAQESTRGVLSRSCSVPDSNNPPALPPPSHGDISVNVSDLTAIGTEECVGHDPAWSQRADRKKETEEWDLLRDSSGERLFDSQRRTLQDLSLSHPAPDLEESVNSACDMTSTSNLYTPNNHMTKSMLCLNEESQDEWISLRDLLTQSGQRLSVNELWALCHTCLSTLQTYIDYPAYLSLDTLYIGCEGEVLFLNPKNTGSCDAFYLAPEFQEHGIVTEKACVYGVAAVLWVTAKFNLSANQKLDMPRKFKRLLLEMAKRTPIERPSIIMAKKSCRDYLLHQGTNAETVWTKLVNRVHSQITKDFEVGYQDGLDRRECSSQESTLINGGFVPMATENRLAPVPGPIPHSYSVSGAPRLPEAFTSPATHFTPIILTREVDPKEETPLLASPVEGSIGEIPRGSDIKHVQVARNPERPSHLEDTPYLMSDEDWTICRPDYMQHSHTCDSSPASSGRTLVNSTPPATSKLTNQSTPVSDHPLPPQTTQLPLSSCFQSPTRCHLIGGCIVNNFLLRQDPQTGHLTLVPVNITNSEFLHGLELNLPMTTSSHSLQSQPGGSRDHLNLCQGAEPQLDFLNGSWPPDCTASLFHYHNGDRGLGAEECGQEPLSKSNGSPQGDTAPLHSQINHTSLHEVIGLLRSEFAFDGYLENDVDGLTMGKYILSLKDLQYQTFCSVVKEKFCDLYWEKDLLKVLHCVVNSREIPQGFNERSSSKPWQRAATASLTDASWRGEKREATCNSNADLNVNLRHGEATTSDTKERFARVQKSLSAQGGRERGPEYRDSQSEEGRYHGHPGLRVAECLVKRAMESVDNPVGGWDESPSDAYSPWGTEEPPSGSHPGQMGPDFSEDMEDTDSVVSERLLSFGYGADESGRSVGSAWALAFYGEDRFSQDVLEYSMNLGHHREPPCLETKAQELQQQIMIEMKNLKKTRNFYQKLFHQERKNKGSEARLMLAKLKVQLEELRSKVDFLYSVKKYLEVLSVDQYGVDVSLLHALAASGPGTVLDLQCSEEPATLGLVSLSWAGRGKSSLQAAMPLGLMAYLYARNAALEGYIQQFLYTYRYFCTPLDLLQFVMDKFTRAAAAGGPDVSGDSAKVYHRSLDVLQTWLTDFRLVDFLPKSSLLMTLENFLITEVCPIDTRGERLLATLKSPLRNRWSPDPGSPIGMQNHDDHNISVLTRKSSIEDSGRKTFHWRISRGVEPKSSQPKDLSYSIGAVLPMPCYNYLSEDPSSGCLRREKRHPFSQSEHSAQHTAQQLTLLQHEMFQSCHPVNFLNSRAQGVSDNNNNVTKQVSHTLLPAEGSSLFVNEDVSQDGQLQHLLRFAESISTWVSAEVVICDSVKTQAALLARFLLIAKHCYESRDFATAMQVLGGLENMIVRQLAAWKHVSTKVCDVLEELRAVQVFLKSDNLCLMGGQHVNKRPTVPVAHILAMHLQQLELGSFKLTSGAYKWPKLRTISKVVSQVGAFQETVYPWAPDQELQAYIRLRIAQLGCCDVPLLAADNQTNFHHTPPDRPSRRIQETLRRMKANFQ